MNTGAPTISYSLSVMGEKNWVQKLNFTKTTTGAMPIGPERNRIFVFGSYVKDMETNTWIIIWNAVTGLIEREIILTDVQFARVSRLTDGNVVMISATLGGITCRVFDQSGNCAELEIKGDACLTRGQTLYPLMDGRLLISGGYEIRYDQLGIVNPFTSSNKCYMLCLRTKTWTDAPPSNHKYVHSAGVLLPNGQLFICGTSCEPNVNSPPTAEIYDPILNEWTNAPQMRTQRTGHVAALSPSGTRVFICGDNGASSRLPKAEQISEIYHIDENRWTVFFDIFPPRRKVLSLFYL